MNGNSKGKIQPSRGIRQGNHLSPHIFILYIDFLGRELTKQMENPKNHIGIPTHRNGPKILFLMFSYDCFILLKHLIMCVITLIEFFINLMLYLANL